MNVIGRDDSPLYLGQSLWDYQQWPTSLNAPILVAVFVVDVFSSKRSKVIQQKIDGKFFRLVSSTTEKNQTANRVGYNKT